jgi:hypothetical protein
MRHNGFVYDLWRLFGWFGGPTKLRQRFASSSPKPRAKDERANQPERPPDIIRAGAFSVLACQPPVSEDPDSYRERGRHQRRL